MVLMVPRATVLMKVATWPALGTMAEKLKGEAM
jgi:hypothetical protein